MMISRIFLILTLFFFTFASSIQKISAESTPERFIVKYRRSITETDKSNIRQNLNLSFDRQINSLNADTLNLRSASDKNEKLKSLSLDPRVEYIEPDYVATTAELSNDPGIVNNLQWGMFKITAAGLDISAWNINKGNKTVKVAVIDTGIDDNHEDLAAKIVDRRNCTDSITSDDLFGHGTHVAGIIAGITNNNIGIAGVGNESTLLNAKALGDNGSGYYSWIADCIVWSVDMGAKVINLSLGGTANSQLLEEAVNYANGKGVVVVAAAGNSNSNSYFYPAAYNHVISVAATDQNDERAKFSNWGSWVDVASPGVSIYSTLPNHPNALKTTNYGYLSGTSMAAPYVSGLAALLSSYENITKEDIINFILNNSDKINGTGKYWIYGRINAYKSLSSAGNNFSNTNSALSTPTPSPTLSPTLTPTTFLSPTLSPTPSKAISPTITPTPTKSSKNPWSRLCSRYPSYCR